MSQHTLYLIIGILVMTLATQITRAFPFLLFAKRKPPQKLIAGARLIPGAVMTILVFTSLPVSGDLGHAEVWMQWLAAGAVALLHVIFRQSLLSILGGTALYMAMLHFWG
ncbi:MULTISPECIES: branched-chain amino acid transporter permease [Sediminispirochaeta]|uniref:Branched-chain amino acid transport n=1 Tax=Sediminispirochaeta smaragdinae (strain DSM 11293 / JCM 15392 / SEBR 4228) TaxID=573413 RepID=E1R2T7_SEDSS|nr:MULTISPECIES: AzlD domain-containing protein [Sediminispirochaeta]ADK80369.1 branched-chain amino acid transport [Sediminispirochaeta smaragdinae DSM 11293]